jgi:hypothetical protein
MRAADFVCWCRARFRRWIGVAPVLRAARRRAFSTDARRRRRSARRAAVRRGWIADSASAFSRWMPVHVGVIREALDGKRVSRRDSAWLRARPAPSTRQPMPITCQRTRDFLRGERGERDRQSRRRRAGRRRSGLSCLTKMRWGSPGEIPLRIRASPENHPGRHPGGSRLTGPSAAPPETAVM